MTIEIKRNKLTLPFIPEHDIMCGLQITLNQYWRMSEDVMPRITCDIIKGQTVYLLPKGIFKKHIKNVAIEIFIK